MSNQTHKFTGKELTELLYRAIQTELGEKYVDMVLNSNIKDLLADLDHALTPSVTAIVIEDKD